MQSLCELTYDGWVILWAICNADHVMLEAMDMDPCWMSTLHTHEFCESIDAFMYSYNRLHQMCGHQGLFKVRPKTHYMKHIVKFVRRTRMNPKSFQTLSSETFLGKLKNCGRTSHGSVDALPGAVLCKWKMAAFARFKEHVRLRRS